MVDSIINRINPLEADVVLLAANYDKSSSFGKGADKGPKAIKGCLDTQVEFYDPVTRTVPRDNCGIAYLDLGNLNRLSPAKMIEKVSAEFEKLYDNDKFVITVGGEHSVSIAPFKVIEKRRRRPEDITVLQIDAHADLREDDSDYSDGPSNPYAHCSVMRRAYGLGLKTVQVGIRAYSKDEQEFMDKNKLTVFKWNEEKLTGFRWNEEKLEVPSVEDIINSIKTERVYLTVDVDGIDPSHMPATGTPVQGGLEWNYTMRLIRQLITKKELIAADVVEVAPRKNDNLTEYGAAQIIYNIIAQKMHR